VPFAFHFLLLHLHLHGQTGRNDTTKPTVYYTDDNGSPCHMDNSISFQRVIDRQDRTPVEGRFNYWNHRSTPWIQEYPHYYRTRTRRKPTTCLVGQPPLRLHPAGHDDETPRKTPRRRQTSHPDFASHLDIQDYSHQDYQPSTLTTDYLARPTNGNSFTGVSHLATNIGLLPLPFLYNPVLSVVLRVDAKHLGNQTTPVCQYHGSIITCTSNSVCVFIVFAIYPKLLNLLLCCLYSTGISPLYFQTIPPWPVPRLSSPLSSRLVRRVVPTLVRSLLLLSLSLQDIPPERSTVRSMSLLLLSLLRLLLRTTCSQDVRLPVL